MKLARVYGLLHLAQAQTQAFEGAKSDTRVSFERAALWYLNQAQDELVKALREHHGLRGDGDEVQTLKELSARELPSAAGDELLAWPYWGACRKALNPRPSVGLIGSVDEDQSLIAEALEVGYSNWVSELEQLCHQLQSAYAEF